MNVITLLHEFIPDELIPLGILTSLLLPELGIGSRDLLSVAATMSMPKTTMHEYG